MRVAVPVVGGVSSGTPPWCSSSACTVRRTNGPSIAANQSGSASRRVQVTFDPRRNGLPQHCICRLSTQTVMIMSPILTAAGGHVEAFSFLVCGYAGDALSHAADGACGGLADDRDIVRWIPGCAAPWWNERSVACRWRGASGMEAQESKRKTCVAARHTP